MAQRSSLSTEHGHSGGGANRPGFRLEFANGIAAWTPEASRKLAGGANHRYVTKVDPSPGRGGGNRATTIPSPLPGLAAYCVCNRWFAPPANFQCPCGTIRTLPQALTLEMRCVLVGLRSRTSLNTNQSSCLLLRLMEGRMPAGLREPSLP